MNILVVAAHPDDEVLGPGGTLAKHKRKGDNVYSCILSEHVAARKNKPIHRNFLKQIYDAADIIGIKDSILFDFPNIKMNTVPMLDLVQAIEKAVIKFKPSIIYTHHAGDLNSDHQAIFNASMAAVRLPERGNVKDLPRNLIKEVLCYEVPSSTEWGSFSPGTVYIPNLFVNIEDTFTFKIKAFRRYREIIKKFPHPRSVESMEALARYRGTQAGYKLAEAFMLVRGIR